MCGVVYMTDVIYYVLISLVFVIAFLLVCFRVCKEFLDVPKILKVVPVYLVIAYVVAVLPLWVFVFWQFFKLFSV